MVAATETAEMEAMVAAAAMVVEAEAEALCSPKITQKCGFFATFFLVDH